MSMNTPINVCELTDKIALELVFAEPGKDDGFAAVVFVEGVGLEEVFFLEKADFILLKDGRPYPAARRRSTARAAAAPTQAGVLAAIRSLDRSSTSTRPT